MMYGIFEEISDYDFWVEDVLSKDKDGCFLVFPTEAQALAHLPKNKLDRKGHGTEYSVQPIGIIGENRGMVFQCPDCGYKVMYEEVQSYNDEEELDEE